MAKESTSDVDIDYDPSQLSNPETRRGKRDRLRITAAVLVFASLLWWSWPRSWIMRCKRPTLTSETVVVGSGNDIPDIGFPESFLQNWGQYSPYIPAATYIPPPPGCIVNQVNLLQRHGARYPTTDSGKDMKAAVKKLQRAKHYKEDYLKFLKHYKWDLGEDDLIPLGARQSFDAGVATYERYTHLFTVDNPPFVRAAGSPRVVDSAANWTEGFRTANHNTIKAKVDLVIPETSNLTLDDAMCPNARDGDKESKKWLKIFAPPIKKRLNSAAPGANLKKKDVYHLMSLCAFHSQFKMAPSPFCGLFETEEFTSYEYHADLGKFYGTGYGAYLGRVQGVGYVNELIARLTGQPVRDNTQTNRTLDSSPETFPLSRTFYADFSHDNEMVAIYSALGLFQQRLLPDQNLDPKNPSPLRTWIVSRMVPFSARMVVERLECPGSLPPPLPKGIFIRIFVNDAIQPLEFCGGVGGLCELHAFLESQSYARHDGEGDFEKCYDKHSHVV